MSSESRPYLIAHVACIKTNWLWQGQVPHVCHRVTVALLLPDNVLTAVLWKPRSKILLLLSLRSSPQPFIRSRQCCGKCSAGNIKGNHNSFILDLQGEKHQGEENTAAAYSQQPEGNLEGSPASCTRWQPLLTHRTELRQTDFSGIYKLAGFQKIFMRMDKSTSLTSGWQTCLLHPNNT